MLKTVISGLGSTIRSSYNISNNPTCVQCVRWRRKPRWMPTAKSKLFRVPERKKEDPEERAELMRLHHNYKYNKLYAHYKNPIYLNAYFFSRTQIRALRSYLMEECQAQRLITSADHVVITPEEELADQEASIRLNDEWNSKIASERNQRIEAKLAERREFILSRLELKEEREKEAFIAAEELVRKEKVQIKICIENNSSKCLFFV